MFFKNTDDFISNNPDFGSAKEPYQSDFGRDWDITWKDHKLSGSVFSEGEAYSQALQPVLDEIHEITGKKIDNFGDAYRGQAEGYQGRMHTDLFLEGLVNLNKFIKQDERLQHLPLFTEELVQIRAGEMARNARKEYEDTVKGMTWGSTTATIAAEGYDMIRNPIGVATLLIGSTTPYGFTAKAFAKHFLYNALAEGTYGLFTRPTVKAWRDKAGIDYDTSAMVADIGIMAGGGGIFGIATNGVVSGVKAILPHVRGKLRNGEIKDPNGDSINEDLIEYVLRETEDEANIINDNPYTKKSTIEKINGEKEHINRHNEAIKILNEEDTALNLKDPVAPIENNLTKERIQEITNPDEAVNFRPEELEVDAKTFQFKSGGDEFGVSDRLKDIKEWEPHFAGQILVFENKNGRMFVADGHQRLALAKRIKKNDPTQDPILSGFVFKEVDGYTPEQIKVIAALKNIAEGTGTPVDASRILRIEPDKFKSLPPRSQLARQGKYLANLSDDAFGLVINEKIPSNYASIIGKLVSDPSKHFPIAKVLIENSPANEFQAEQIVRQALSSGFTKVKEQTLFGQEMLMQSLFKERATVLDNALRLLKQDKKVFNTLVRNHTRIEQEGNQLLRDANKRKEMIDATAQEILKKESNKKGNLSDNLTAIAKEYKETGKLGPATAKFVESIRRAVSEGNIDGDSVGGIGATFETKEKIPLVPEQSEPIPGFDDVKKSKAIEQQGNQLQRITEEEIGVREGFEDDKAIRIDLKNKMQDENFGTEKILKHPAIISALEKAKAIPITVKDPNYGTVSWLEKRKFKMKNWSATGYMEGIDKHVLHAERLAWEEDDLIPEPVLQDKKSIILIGAPASGKSSIANIVARKTKSAIVDVDEVKKSLPEFQDGLGANATHLEGKVIIDEVLDESIKKGNNIITPIVGHTGDKVLNLQKKFKDKGYSVQLIYMDVKPPEVFKRMIRRFIETGRIIMPSYVLGIGNKPKITYNKLKGKFDEFAEIDNNQKIGESPTALEISNEEIIQGTGIRLRSIRPDSRRDATSTQEGIAETTLKELEVDLPFDTSRKLYHGTRAKDLKTFSPDAIGSANDEGFFGRGFYFANSYGEASYYGPNVFEYYNKGKLFNFDSKVDDATILNSRRFMEWAETLKELNVLDDMHIKALDIHKAADEWIKKNGDYLLFQNADGSEGYTYRIKHFLTEGEEGTHFKNATIDTQLDPFGNAPKTKKEAFDKAYNNFVFELRNKSKTDDIAKDIHPSMQGLSDYELYSFTDYIREGKAAGKNAELLTTALQKKGYSGAVLGDETVIFNPEDIIRVSELEKQKADSSIYDNIPIAQVVDDQEVLTTQSRTDILNEINQDKKMLNRLEDCA